MPRNSSDDDSRGVGLTQSSFSSCPPAAPVTASRPVDGYTGPHHTPPLFTAASSAVSVRRIAIKSRNMRCDCGVGTALAELLADFFGALLAMVLLVTTAA